MKYVHLEPSAALDQFVQNKLNTLTKRLHAHPRRYKFSLKLEVTSRKPTGVANNFRVTGAVKVLNGKNLLVIRKGVDAKKLISQVIENLEKQVRRDSEKRERSRKTFGKSLRKVRSMKWEMSSLHS